MNYLTATRPWAGSTCRLTARWLIWLGVAFISMTAAAQEEDVVIFNNGDRLSGDIRGLSRGSLAFNTDATGTIRIEWIEVAELRSSDSFEIYLTDGQRYFGSLAAPEEQGQLYVDAGDTEPFALPFTRVIIVTPIESTIRARLDVDLNFGYNFTKSSDVEQLTFATEVIYQAEENIIAARLRTIRTEIGVPGGSTDQTSLDFGYTKLLRDRWFASGLAGFESNSELGLDLRTTLGGGGGRILSQSVQHRVAVLAGLIRTQEDVVGSDQTRNSVEGLANLSIDWYRSDDKEFDVSSRLTLYPSFSESGRYRSEFNLDLDWGLYRNITWGLIFYHKFDTDPPVVGTARADYGVITSVGVDF